MSLAGPGGAVQTRDHALPEALRGPRDLPRTHRPIECLTNMRASRDRNTPRSTSATAAASPVCARRPDRSATATITRCARVSSRRWNASCWTGVGSGPTPRHAWPSSSSSRDGTIPAGGTRPSAICHLSTTKGASYPPLAQIHNRPRNRGNSRSRESLNCRQRCGARPWARQILCMLESDSPLASTMARPVQWVASPNGGPRVRSITFWTWSASIGRMRDGRVLSCRRPSTPCSWKRSRQRQTVFLVVPSSRTMALVPSPLSVARMIRARVAWPWGVLRSRTIASSR